MNLKPAKNVFIVPHTHWDREWYLPFQQFRYKLVQLVDILLTILDSEESFRFTFDGQTSILEDYLEIRPENESRLLGYIREKKIAVGPWYVLPDVWLANQESLIRNLEYSQDLANRYGIKQMKIGYLPDTFGFTRGIPQIIGDLTDFRAIVVWRGVPPEIKTVPFLWRSSPASEKPVFTNYLPFGYGNAALLPESTEELETELKSLVSQLEPFSPIPIYLLLHGTDHQVPSLKLSKTLPQIKVPNMAFQISLLEDYIESLLKLIKEVDFPPPEYSGELRSAARAHILVDTYSARMWIKLWNQKVEDLLTHYAEPLCCYSWLYFHKEYPSSFLTEAWKYHLQNQAHDSICGCSIDQTHEEMKARYSWTQTIAETIIEDELQSLEAQAQTTDHDSIIVYNPTNCSDLPLLVEFTISGENKYHSVISSKGEVYKLQPFQDSREKLWEMTVGSLKLRALMRLLPGRKIMTFYINEVSIFDNSTNPKICEAQLIVGDKPLGEFDLDQMKKSINSRIQSGKYTHFHMIVTKEMKMNYIALIPLQAWSFSQLKLMEEGNIPDNRPRIQISKDWVIHPSYEVRFQKDGSFNLFEKELNLQFRNLHFFEDWGDRGDEYTFGRIGPESVKIFDIKREVTLKGPLVYEIQQSMTLKLFQEVDDAREKRIGSVKIPVTTKFKFYSNINRIDIQTTLINTAKDHRLRICFLLPFKTQYTHTSTHFGIIKRFAGPIGDDSYLERPSGIQSQKRFIRVNDPSSEAAFTLMNWGIPEVELRDESVLAMTLIRSIGWLAQSNFPERPELAGPAIATPNAQELNREYRFLYSIRTHTKKEPLFKTADHSEAFSLLPKALYLAKKILPAKLVEPMFKISDARIRVSSMRIRNKNILLTLFNLDEAEVTVTIEYEKKITRLSQILIDSSLKGAPRNGELISNLTFHPHEIKLLSLGLKE